jgi:cytochrome c553
VIEADTVPKTQPTGWHLAMAPEDGTEPIGQRIIEVPENLAYFSSRDGRAQFIAYVPPASLKKGEELVATGAAKTVSCRICHGQDLKGFGNIPGIAGRSPSYIIRQLYDFQVGNRAGVNAALMKPVVDKLSMGDMIAVAGYVASLEPH